MFQIRLYCGSFWNRFGLGLKLRRRDKIWLMRQEVFGLCCKSCYTGCCSSCCDGCSSWLLLLLLLALLQLTLMNRATLGSNHAGEAWSVQRPTAEILAVEVPQSISLHILRARRQPGARHPDALTMTSNKQLFRQVRQRQY